MRYERPAVERRVKVKDPVITVAAASPATATPTWASHDEPDES